MRWLKDSGFCHPLFLSLAQTGGSQLPCCRPTHGGARVAGTEASDQQPVRNGILHPPPEWAWGLDLLWVSPEMTAALRDISSHRTQVWPDSWPLRIINVVVFPVSKLSIWKLERDLKKTVNLPEEVTKSIMTSQKTGRAGYYAKRLLLFRLIDTF